MSYLTETYQSFENFRNFLTDNNFELRQVTMNTDNKVEYYKNNTYHGYIVVQYPVQKHIDPFIKRPKGPCDHFEMIIREPLFTTLNSPVFPLEGHYDIILNKFNIFNKMIKAIL